MAIDVLKFVRHPRIAKLVIRDHPWIIPTVVAIVIAIHAIHHDWLGVSASAVMLTGALMNLTVIRANGGFMPVVFYGSGKSLQVRLYPSKLHLNIHIAGGPDPAESTDMHCLCTEKTRFARLCDRFFIPGGSGMYSIGDILLMAGVCMVLWRTWLAL